MATIDIRLRVPEEMKSDAEAIFQQMGMTMSEAMRIFLSQCVNTGGLPFKPHSKIPNKETLESFRQIETGEYETYTIESFEEVAEPIEFRSIGSRGVDLSLRTRSLSISMNGSELLPALSSD